MPLVSHFPFLLQLRPSLCLDRCCCWGYRQVHALPPRSLWSSEVEPLPEASKMNKSPPKAKSPVYKPVPVRWCSCGQNQAYSPKLDIQLQSCLCFPLVTPFNSTLVTVTIICLFFVLFLKKILLSKLYAGCYLCCCAVRIAVRFSVYFQFL